MKTTSRAEIVDRLLEQAQQHVDIHKVFGDRGFDSPPVRGVLDQHSVSYILGKQKRSSDDYENIRKIANDPVYAHRIEHAELTYEGTTHKVSIIYLPTDSDSDSGDADVDGYSMFTVSGHVQPDRADALVE